MGSMFGREPGRQLQPQNWTSNQTQGPPPWLMPYLQGGMGAQGDIFNSRLAGRGAPPTFGDVSSGRYQSNFGQGSGVGPVDFAALQGAQRGPFPPQAPLGVGGRPTGGYGFSEAPMEGGSGPLEAPPFGGGPGIRGPYGGPPQEGPGLRWPPFGGRGRGQDNDPDKPPPSGVERQMGYGSRDAPPRMGDAEIPRGAADLGGMRDDYRPGRRPPGPGPGGGGGGRGGGGGGGQTPDAMAGYRNDLASMMMGRAAQPSQGLAAGTDFLTQLLGKNPADRGGNQWSANPLMNMAGNQAQRTFEDTTRADAPINQLISRQMSQGNASAPYQSQFIDQLFGRFNAPPPSTDTPVGSRYDLMSQFGSSEPLFDPSRSFGSDRRIF